MFVNQGNTLRVISIHDISNELDAKELESWQKLIRVLTHEIMNSITPITSLSETLLKYYVPSGKRVGESSDDNATDNKATDAKVTGSKPVDETTIANTVKGL